MAALAELSSLSTALDDLTARLRGLIGGLEGPERVALETDLAEVERTLDVARRRLSKLVRTPPAPRR